MPPSALPSWSTSTKAQIAPGLQAGQGVVDGEEFAVDFGGVAGAGGALQAKLQQGQHFAVFAPALAGVLVEDDVVEHAAQDAGLLDDVLVAPVACAADDDAALVGGHGAHGLHQGAHGVGVVAVVAMMVAPWRHRVLGGPGVAGAFGARAVAAVDLAAIDPDAVGVGHGGAPAVRCEQMRQHAGGGGFAVGAGDGDERDAAIVARREHLIDHGHAHVARPPERGRQVHAQAGRGVDFDDAAALLFQRFEHGFAHHIHAADVQADGLRGFNGAGGDFGVYVVGHIGGAAAGGQVGVVAQHHALALRGHAGGRQAFAGDAGDGDVVEPDFAGAWSGLCLGRWIRPRRWWNQTSRSESAAHASPSPVCTSERGGQAPEGDATGHGASTMAPVEGPMRSSSSRSRSAAMAASVSKVGVTQRGVDQRLGFFKRQLAHGFFGVFDDDLEGAALHRLVRAAEGDGAARLRLQRQRRHFKHMGQRQRLRAAMRLQRPDGGKARAQPLFKTGDGGVELLASVAVDDGFDGGAAGPEVGATQGADAGDLHSLPLAGVQAILACSAYLVCASACNGGDAWQAVEDERPLCPVCGICCCRRSEDCPACARQANAPHQLGAAAAVAFCQAPPNAIAVGIRADFVCHRRATGRTVPDDSVDGQDTDPVPKRREDRPATGQLLPGRAAGVCALGLGAGLGAYFCAGQGV
ncbi:hypothetical protein FQA39_LY18673 [Lamprigera yunnana]|nr:hypothetical protein FQA39_LY18673 [Lamprigera yunnana]